MFQLPLGVAYGLQLFVLPTGHRHWYWWLYEEFISNEYDELTDFVTIRHSAVFPQKPLEFLQYSGLIHVQESSLLVQSNATTWL
jgi:hypothetical protein